MAAAVVGGIATGASASAAADRTRSGKAMIVSVRVRFECGAAVPCATDGGSAGHPGWLSVRHKKPCFSRLWTGSGGSAQVRPMTDAATSRTSRLAPIGQELALGFVYWLALVVVLGPGKIERGAALPFR